MYVGACPFIRIWQQKEFIDCYGTIVSDDRICDNADDKSFGFSNLKNNCWRVFHWNLLVTFFKLENYLKKLLNILVLGVNFLAVYLKNTFINRSWLISVGNVFTFKNRNWYKLRNIYGNWESDNSSPSYQAIVYSVLRIIEFLLLAYES